MEKKKMKENLFGLIILFILVNGIKIKWMDKVIWIEDICKNLKELLKIIYFV